MDVNRGTGSPGLGDIGGEFVAVDDFTGVGDHDRAVGVGVDRVPHQRPVGLEDIGLGLAPPQRMRDRDRVFDDVGGTLYGVVGVRRGRDDRDVVADADAVVVPFVAEKLLLAHSYSLTAWVCSSLARSPRP